MGFVCYISSDKEMQTTINDISMPYIFINSEEETVKFDQFYLYHLNLS